VNAEEKAVLTRFLDLAGDYLGGGYARNRETQASENLSTLPLAYQVEEEDTEDPMAETAEDIAAAIGNCDACGLCTTRKRAVPGEGVNNPLVMVVGEGPGADEDEAGRPFVGRAGQLLDKMLASIGLSRNKNCYIANMVKCRPPGNRDPEPHEIAACFPYLERQMALLNPRIILCAGRVAAQSLLKTNKGIGLLRNEFFEMRIRDRIIPVLCTYHPSAILRDESLKRPAWEDLKLLKSKLEMYEI